MNNLPFPTDTPTDTPSAGVSVANPITLNILPSNTDTPDTCSEKVLFKANLKPIPKNNHFFKKNTDISIFFTIFATS